VVPGFLGAYPNALYQVAESELEDVVSMVERLGNEEDYQTQICRFGVGRNNPNF
jgi:hypothetical protein